MSAVQLQARPPDLTGAHAVVTGGGQGLGAAIACGLAAAGAHVVIDGRHEESLRRTCAEIGSAGGSAGYLTGDVTSPAHVTELMSAAASADGVLDILVNNAGIAGPVAPLGDIRVDEWNQTLAVNLTGVFLATQAALPALTASGHGKIVNLGSVAGKQPLVNRLPYAATKAGLIGLTRTLAQELAPRDISVNLISPYLVEGARLDHVVSAVGQISGRSPDEVRAEMTRSTAFGRVLAVANVVNTVLWLCSSATRNLTGLDINVTGGSVMY